MKIKAAKAPSPRRTASPGYDFGVRARGGPRALNLVTLEQAERLLNHVKLTEKDKKAVPGIDDPTYPINADQAERLLTRLVLTKSTVKKLGMGLNPGAQVTLSAGCCCTSYTHVKQR